MRSRPRSPVWIPPGSTPLFPDPGDFDRHGLIAGGGDLSQARLLNAYRAGIFPWYDEPPILWWSPDPRAVVTRSSMHVSRSLRRTLRSTTFTVTESRAFLQVMDGCATRPEGTWLRAEMKSAYLALHHAGHAKSYEVWDGPELVGGLYGVSIGGFFAAESKFHRRTDASKIALVCAIVDLFERGVTLFDVQFLTDHLSTMGVFEMPRAQYLHELNDACELALRAGEARDDLLPHVLSSLQP